MRQDNDTYPKDCCGIFGVSGSKQAALDTYQGLQALQHRGEESSGMVGQDGQGKLISHRGMGLASNVFTKEILETFKGPVAIGHNRYSTTGSSCLENAQPLLSDTSLGQIALAHNGNLTNTTDLRKELQGTGATFMTSTDSEVMLKLIARCDGGKEGALAYMMSRVIGAYSLVILIGETLIGLRDPRGFRPLSIGKRASDDALFLSSETCAFDVMGAKLVRDVEPGEIVVIENGRIASIPSASKTPPAFCVFEYVYFARPDSLIGGRSVASIRIAMGAELAREHPIQADVVVPILDSGIYAALGYSQALGIPMVLAYVRNHYVGRSFILPQQERRDGTAHMKLNLIPEMVRDKRVILVDDSIVRGTTCQNRCRTVREAGAKEVHMLVSCPPHRHGCLYGIDFPDPDKLIANKHHPTEIVEVLGLDSLGYLSEAGMVGSLPQTGVCLACFNGKYPTRTT